ncbi:putative transcription factor interactor and regulator CCHC(Zn) family [Rosa chinensis]|uniref:Putative transcription factor interactor and regulator CCHC(Zn) family n=1 Tax=Rosa chinensis TaxID=74649 RepID=A0A2P6RHQ2_ROSCH|nr:putative transcription factor interactor and regulator CCHC(Zn) family [Rosa chinensis]
MALWVHHSFDVGLPLDAAAVSFPSHLFSPYFPIILWLELKQVCSYCAKHFHVISICPENLKTLEPGLRICILLCYVQIIYRPLKHLNGILGAKNLLMCLTGYQGQDRDDIMTIVGLIGAQFSKPLVASKVTHLICYKFEGMVSSLWSLLIIKWN